jgi:hypothetical protein
MAIKRLIFIIPLIPVLAFAQTLKLNIRTAHGSIGEMKRKQQIERLAERFDLSKYTITRELVIEQGAVNHSFPVLTLNLWVLDNDERSLSLYLHEQAHWLLKERYPDKSGDLVAELTKLYPDLDFNQPHGDGNKRSSYMHMVVIMLEWQALEALIGASRARAVLEFKGRYHYWDLFATVLKHRSQMEDVLKHAGVSW